jgi:hypothetical protein
MPATTCLFCGQRPDGLSSDGRLAACKNCIRHEVIPMLLSAYEPQELVEMVRAGEGRDRFDQPGSDRDDRRLPRGSDEDLARDLARRGALSPSELSLVSRAAQVRRTAARERRPLAAAELSLSLSGTEVLQAGLTRSRLARRPAGAAADRAAAQAMVARLGMGGPATASGVQMSAGPGRPPARVSLGRPAQRRLGRPLDPQKVAAAKAAAKEMVEKLGLSTVPA